MRYTTHQDKQTKCHREAQQPWKLQIEANSVDHRNKSRFFTTSYFHKRVLELVSIFTGWVKHAKDSLFVCQHIIFNNWTVKRVPDPRSVSVFRYMDYMRTFDKPPSYLKPPFIRLPSSLVAGNSGVQLERSNYCFLTRLQATLPPRPMTFAAHLFQGILPQSDGFIIWSQPTRTDGVVTIIPLLLCNSVVQFSHLVKSGCIIGLEITPRSAQGSLEYLILIGCSTISFFHTV